MYMRSPNTSKLIIMNYIPELLHLHSVAHMYMRSPYTSKLIIMNYIPESCLYTFGILTAYILYIVLLYIQINFLEDYGCTTTILHLDPDGELFGFGSTEGQNFLSCNPEVVYKFRSQLAGNEIYNGSMVVIIVLFYPIPGYWVLGT